MENLVLNATARNTSVKAKYVRQKGRIPAVVYGKKAENIFVDFDYQEFRKIFQKAGHNTIIDLVVDNAKPVETLVHVVDYDPVSGNFAHIDFHKITRGQELTTDVPVKFVGVSEAVKTLGGILMTNKESLRIKCLPKNLIHEVFADISVLADLHSKITVGDLDVPATITVLNAPDEVVATVTSSRAVIEDEEPTALVEPEVTTAKAPKDENNED